MWEIGEESSFKEESVQFATSSWEACEKVSHEMPCVKHMTRSWRVMPDYQIREYFARKAISQGTCETLCLTKIWGNYSKPTCGLVWNHFAYPWFKKCHFTHLRYVPFVFRNPPLLKSGVNRYFCMLFMSLSS